MIGELMIGGGCALLGNAIGHLQGYLMGVKVRNVSSLIVEPPKPKGSESLWCLCAHGKHTHSYGGRGACDVTTRPGYTCACTHFVPDPAKAPKTKKDLLDLSSFGE